MSTTPPVSRPRAIVRIHFHPQLRSDELFAQLLDVLGGISPTIEPLPADWSAYMDVTGSLRFWDRDVEGLVAVIRLRLLALHGVQSSAGAGPTRAIAAMAASVTAPGAATIVGCTPYEVAAFLRPRPAAALPGVGPKTARTLGRYGITTVGDLADTPPATLQRILGAAARQIHTLAHGVDERPVVPAAAPRSMSAGHRFDRDELDTDQHQRTVLALAEDLGGRLREAAEIAQALTLTVTYADHTQPRAPAPSPRQPPTPPRWQAPHAGSWPTSDSSAPACEASACEQNGSVRPSTPPTSSPSATATKSSTVWKRPSTGRAPATAPASPARPPPSEESQRPDSRSTCGAGQHPYSSSTARVARSSGRSGWVLPSSAGPRRSVVPPSTGVTVSTPSSTMARTASCR